jgi:hypothetical protein
MTPFMISVRAVLDGEPAPDAAMTESRPVAVPIATDTQVIIRSLAEQLVSEANAILREHGEVVTLDDEVGPSGLTFTLGYRDRAARVQTVMAGRFAIARLIVDGRTDDTPRQLTSEDELASFLLSLIDTAPTV